MGNIVNRVFDSSGPEGKVRGTPQQIIDKYLALARDAQLSNDRVAAENFLQHAEHYARMLGEAQREIEAQRRDFGGGQQQGQQGGDDRGESRDERGEGGDDQRRDDQRRDGRRGDERRAERQDRREDQREAKAATSDVIDVDDGRDTGLVETPETRAAASESQPPAAEARPPRQQRRPRRPRGQSPEGTSETGPETPPERPEAAE